MPRFPASMPNGLIRATDVERLDRLLQPEVAGDWIARPVSRAVSNARNEGARLIEPLPDCCWRVERTRME
jgi:hypothetical protein